MPEQQNNNNAGRFVALYWDFENLHASLCEGKDPGSYARPDNRFKPQEPLVDIQAIVDMAASFGPIAINRAFCNWQFFGRYRDVLLQNAVELVQLFPPGATAKNGADIKLCLDAAEDMARFPHIATVIVVAGDSDFMPLAQKVRAAGRKLVGVGTRQATNRHWAKSCHEFRHYEDIVKPSEPPHP
jgi:uncharacterized LabA/DUF88 family protein